MGTCFERRQYSTLETLLEYLACSRSRIASLTRPLRSCCRESRLVADTVARRRATVSWNKATLAAAAALLCSAVGDVAYLDVCLVGGGRVKGCDVMFVETGVSCNKRGEELIDCSTRHRHTSQMFGGAKPRPRASRQVGPCEMRELDSDADIITGTAVT